MNTTIKTNSNQIGLIVLRALIRYPPYLGTLKCDRVADLAILPHLMARRRLSKKFQKVPKIPDSALACRQVPILFGRSGLSHGSTSQLGRNIPVRKIPLRPAGRWPV